MANDQEVKYLVPGLERGLQLLLAFGEQHRDLTFAELHRLVDMPKATAYRGANAGVYGLSRAQRAHQYLFAGDERAAAGL